MGTNYRAEFLAWRPDGTNYTTSYTFNRDPLPLTPPSLTLIYPELAYICSPDSGCRFRVKGCKLNVVENNIYDDGIVVERKDATTNTWQAIVTLLPNATTWTDTANLIGSLTYTYRVKCFNVDTVVYSNLVTVKTRPKPGVNFKAAVTSVTTLCVVDGAESPEAESPEGFGEIGPNAPPGYCTYKTNRVNVSWNAPPNQNPAVPIVNYRVDAFWLKNRAAMCPCFGCFPVTQPWETFEQSVTVSATSAIVCTQQQDTLYSFYITAFDAAGDSSLLWIKQTCPPDSKLVVQQAWAYPGGFCVNPCCGYAKPASPIASSVSSSLPTEFALEPNSPNPFNPSTTIRYALPKEARVELRIYNILGQVVRRLVEEEKPAGYHQTLWDGRDEAGRPVSTGIYLYQIRAGDFVETMKMMLMK